MDKQMGQNRKVIKDLNRKISINSLVIINVGNIISMLVLLTFAYNLLNLRTAVLYSLSIALGLIAISIMLVIRFFIIYKRMRKIEAQERTSDYKNVLCIVMYFINIAINLYGLSALRILFENSSL